VAPGAAEASPWPCTAAARLPHLRPVRSVMFGSAPCPASGCYSDAARLDRTGRRMGTLRPRTGRVPRHRAAVGSRWIGALTRHRWHAALVVGSAIVLASAMVLLPGRSAPPAASGCGQATCTPRRVTPVAAAAESSASLRGVSQAPARARTAPAGPGGRARATASQLAPHHGRAKGLTRRHCRPPGCR